MPVVLGNTAITGADTYQPINGITSMTITSQGYVKQPAIPCFYAWHNAAASTTTTGVVVFNSTRVNRGNGYNTTNGRFTAPVAGYYQFNAHLLYRDQGYVEMSWQVNGSNLTRHAYSDGGGGNSGAHLPVQFTTTRYLNVNDWIAVSILSFQGGTPANIYYGENLGHFSGKLLG